MLMLLLLLKHFHAPVSGLQLRDPGAVCVLGTGDVQTLAASLRKGTLISRATRDSSTVPCACAQLGQGCTLPPHSSPAQDQRDTKEGTWAPQQPVSH